jgi:hypothetical protein
MRFVYGADFTARRVVKHLAASARNGRQAKPSPGARRRCRV